VALRKSSEGVAPYVFQKAMTLQVWKSPPSTVMTLVSKLHKRFPEIRLGV